MATYNFWIVYSDGSEKGLPVTAENESVAEQNAWFNAQEKYPNHRVESVSFTSDSRRDSDYD